MESSKLDQMFDKCSRLDRFYEGLHTVDKLSDFDVKTAAADAIYVIFTGTSHSTFAHFVLVVKIGDEVVFFDSFGKMPAEIDERIARFIDRLESVTLQINRKQVQAVDTCTCAIWVFFVACYLIDGFSLEQIVDRFSTANLRRNDRFVFKWANAHLPVSKSDLLDCKNMPHY